MVGKKQHGALEKSIICALGERRHVHVPWRDCRVRLPIYIYIRTCIYLRETFYGYTMSVVWMKRSVALEKCTIHVHVCALGERRHVYTCALEGLQNKITLGKREFYGYTMLHNQLVWTKRHAAIESL